MANFWERLAALALDVGVIIVLLFVTFIGTAKSNSEGDANGAAVVFFFYLSVAALYVPITMALGGTAGTRIVGLRIVKRSNGSRPGVIRCLARAVVSVISVALLLGGYFWMLRDQRRQTWHDHLAGTIVLKL